MEQQRWRDPYGLENTTLLEKYYIERIVGMGGMGAVYRARHLRLNRIVALKFLEPKYAYNHPEMVKTFTQEARATAALSGNPYVVVVFDAEFTPQGQPFLVMEWLDGHTLDEELDFCKFEIRYRILWSDDIPAHN